MNRFLCIVLTVVCMWGCTHQSAQKLPAFDSNDISHVITQMTDIMIHDITNPPLAARFFAYACVAGYEVVSQHDTAQKSLRGIMNGYPDLKKPDSIQGYSIQLSALLAMMETAKKIQPSGSRMADYQKKFLDSCRRIGYPEEVIAHSLQYASAISKKILAYAKADNYSKISNYPRYTPVDQEGCWYPTPPAYMAAVEPYFSTVRPFILDSCSMFRCEPPVVFSKEKSSAFYRLVEAVYKEGVQPPMEHRVIAAFWDCNPFAVRPDGHLMLGLKKISPGAHWLGITGIACAQANKSFEESMQIFTMVAAGLTDAFISCWDEKFRSNRIRPETAIRKYIDPNWQPLLQTPPFPEYLSGHSVISSSSAIILTHYFGNHFSYTDSVEVSYGLPARHFPSFVSAAKEAAISRFYGGIHFTDAIDNGLAQGQKIGNRVIEKLISGRP